MSTFADLYKEATSSHWLSREQRHHLARTETPLYITDISIGKSKNGNKQWVYSVRIPTDDNRVSLLGLNANAVRDRVAGMILKQLESTKEVGPARLCRRMPLNSKGQDALVKPMWDLVPSDMHPDDEVPALENPAAEDEDEIPF